MMIGAIREDDVKYDEGAKESPPQDEPNANFDRVLNHFYDPYHNISLSLATYGQFGETITTPLGSMAPNWAIDGDSGGMLSSRTNHFSIRHAKEALFRAATLRTLKNGQLKELVVSMIGPPLSQAEQRKAYWATVFRALGDVVHTLQDMGQPQHTRNDAHAGMGCSRGEDSCAFGHASFYENYLEARVARDNTFTLTKRFFSGGSKDDVSPQFELPAPPYDGYDIPRFNAYRDYYSTGTGEASYTGKGLANYSNKGFYSAGTNIGWHILEHQRPPKNGEGLVPDTKWPGQVLNINGDPVEDEDAILMLLRYPVEDSLTGAVTPNVPISSISVFNHFMQKKQGENAKPIYTLNHYNYNAMADLLLPRAVSYSAGLIDYFFRGRMEISLPKEGVYSIVDHAQFAPPAQPQRTDPVNGFKGFGKIKMRLKNTTESIQTSNGPAPQNMSSGIVVATLKFYRNLSYTDDLDGELETGNASHAQFIAQRSKQQEMIVSDPVTLTSLAAGEVIDLTFNFPQELPINAWVDVELGVVYRGKLGDEEDAVIVSQKDMAQPIFLSMHNVLDYFGIGDGYYSEAQVLADDALWNQLVASCKGEGHTIAEACKSQPMTLRINFGGGGNMTTFRWENFAIPARRFARVAFLIDDDYVAMQGSAYSPEGARLNNWTRSFDSMATHYIPFGHFRGVKTDEFWGLAIDADGRGGTRNFTAGHPTLLDGDERYPVPATSITGW